MSALCSIFGLRLSRRAALEPPAFFAGRKFFDTWFGLIRVVVIGVAAYAALVMLLRVSGKRTLGKMNAFDLVVTVALGSAFATVVLDKSVPARRGRGGVRGAHRPAIRHHLAVGAACGWVRRWSRASRRC